MVASSGRRLYFALLRTRSAAWLRTGSRAPRPRRRHARARAASAALGARAAAPVDSLELPETDRLIDAATGRARAPFAPALAAYYARREFLFARYADGIRLDATGWFSVTPERIAASHARACAARSGLALDAFAGVGGDAIQLARTCARVLALEIDPSRARLLQHNARVYGVGDRVDVVCCDFYRALRTLRADTLFLSPPWGGPQGFRRDAPFDVERGLQPPLSATLALVRAHGVAARCVIFLPRNTDVRGLFALAEWARGERCRAQLDYDHGDDEPLLAGAPAADAGDDDAAPRGQAGKARGLTAVFELVLDEARRSHPPPAPAERRHTRWE
jgi:hypothetical protein